MDVLALPTTWFWLLFLQPPPTYLPDLTFVISPIKKTVTYTHHTPQHTQRTHSTHSLWTSLAQASDQCSVVSAVLH